MKNFFISKQSAAELTEKLIGIVENDSDAYISVTIKQYNGLVNMDIFQSGKEYVSNVILPEEGESIDKILEVFNGEE